MIKYKIEGQYLDQFTEEEFAVTKAISKIGEIDLRHGDFSTSFKVPLTAKNIAILRYTPELNNLSKLDNFKRYNGDLVEDDVVVSDGYYQVTGFNATKKEATLNFFGGNSEWFDLLKDRYINDVIENTEYSYDLIDSNHLFTRQNIVNSWDGNLPYFYFLCDNGSNSDKIMPKTALSDWQVSYYQSYIFNRIFDSVGIKTKGTLFNDADFYDTVIASNKNLIEVKGELNRLTEYTLGATSSEITHEGTTPRNDISFDQNGENEQWSGTTFKAANNITQVRFRARVVVQKNAFITGMDMYYNRNGSAYVLVPMTDEGVINLNERSFYQEIVLNNINAGDIIKIEYAYKASTISRQAVLRKFSRFEIEEIGVQPQVTASEVIPKIKQTDFIKDIMISNGVVSQYDVVTRTLTLDKFEGIDDNRVNAPDWSRMIDLSKDVSVNYTKILSNYGKKSIIAYADDTDNDIQLKVFKETVGEGLGDGIIFVDNDFLSDEKTVYKSPYAATITHETFENDGYYLPFIPTLSPSNEANDVKPRKLLAKKIDVRAFNTVGSTNVEIENIPYTECGYAYFAKRILNGTGNQDLNSMSYGFLYSNTKDQMDIGETLLERNYNLYKKILNDPFYVSLYMNLTALDVQQVDFLTPIFLDYQYDSGYYYIDSIEQYKGDGTTTKVNLVKI